MHGSGNTNVGDRNKTPSKRPGRRRAMSLQNELFLTLMRLRLGLLHQDLAYRFKTNTRQVSTIILTWIQLLYKQFGTIRNLMFSTRDKVRQRLRSALKSRRTSAALLTAQKFMYNHPAILRHKEINIIHIKGIPHISFWLQ